MNTPEKNRNNEDKDEDKDKDKVSVKENTVCSRLAKLELKDLCESMNDMQLELIEEEWGSV